MFSKNEQRLKQKNWTDAGINLSVIFTGERPPRSPGVDPKQLAAELQKVSQQQAPSSTSSSSLPAPTSATSSPGQPGSPSISKKRHSSKARPVFFWIKKKKKEKNIKKLPNKHVL